MESFVTEEEFNALQISSRDAEENEIPKKCFEDDESDEYDDEERVPVTLGFVNKPKNRWSLLRQYFPSKAGGTPAWLDPVNLPSGKSSLCDFCSEPLHFLLQVYAPLSETSTFHRTLFVFMCPSMACLLRDQHEQWKRHPNLPCRSVKVFRCQLPRENSFYSSEAPVEDGNEQPLISGAKLCDWCGTWKGDKVCGSCKIARYCSGKHQAAHWRSTDWSHKARCQQLETFVKPSESVSCSSLWPEFEITNEDECDFSSEMLEDSASSSALISKTQLDGFTNFSEEFEADGDKRSWASFQERISLAPDQVLRYSSDANAKPLWPMNTGKPTKLDIPKCNSCGGNRGFEFQVLPQLLYFFQVKDTDDSLDWANIVIYTCENSCEGYMAYKEEFAWVQLASHSIPQNKV